MKQVLEITRLYLVRTFSSRAVLVTQLLLPIVFTFLLGLALDRGDDNAPETWPVVVVNADNGRLAQAFIEQMETDTLLEVWVRDEAEARQLIADDDVAVAVLLPIAFTSKLEAGEGMAVDMLVSGANPTAQLISQRVQAAASRVIGRETAVTNAETILNDLGYFDAGYDREAFLAQAQTISEADEPTLSYTAQAETRLETAQPQQIPNGMNQSSPGQTVMFAMFLMLGGASVIISEREGGTLRRLMTMPISKSTVIMGKFLGIYATGLIQMLILIIFGAILGVPWGQAPLALALVVLAFGFAVTSLSMMFAALVRTNAQANALSTILVLSLASLGGAWWPLEIVPDFMQTIALFTPVSWAMTGFHDVITRGLGVGAVLPETAVLLLFGGLFLFVGIRGFRYE